MFVVGGGGGVNPSSCRLTEAHNVVYMHVYVVFDLYLGLADAFYFTIIFTFPLTCETEQKVFVRLHLTSFPGLLSTVL